LFGERMAARRLARLSGLMAGYSQGAPALLARPCLYGRADRARYTRTPGRVIRFKRSPRPANVSSPNPLGGTRCKGAGLVGKFHAASRRPLRAKPRPASGGRPYRSVLPESTFRTMRNARRGGDRDKWLAACKSGKRATHNVLMHERPTIQ
jgi:hypothetical protein